MWCAIALFPVSTANCQIFFQHAKSRLACYSTATSKQYSHAHLHSGEVPFPSNHRHLFLQHLTGFVGTFACLHSTVPLMTNLGGGASHMTSHDPPGGGASHMTSHDPHLLQLLSQLFTVARHALKLSRNCLTLFRHLVHLTHGKVTFGCHDTELGLV